MHSIIFKELHFKNFMSYGNSTTVFNFNTGMTLLTGLNGNGKSAIMMSLFYCLYGKPFKKNKLGSLVNDINAKDMRVELYFSINDIEYKIVRGQKPNIFEIYENNALVEQNSSVSEYQNYLETYILKITEHSFRQLIFLGANIVGAKSFVDLTKSEKEELFQLITDTGIFTLIKDNIKERNNSFKTQSTELKYKIDVINETIDIEKNNIFKIEQHNKNINTLSADRKAEIESRILDISIKEEEILKVLSKIKAIKEQYDNDNAEISKIQPEVDALSIELNSVNSLLQKINTAKQAFSECIGCAKLNNIAKIDLSKETEYLDKKASLEQDYNYKKSLLTLLYDNVKDSRSKLDKGKIGKEQLDAIRLEKVRLEKEISTINDSKPLDIDYEIIERKTKELEDFKKDFTNVSSEMSKLKTLDGLLSNENLKGVIINQTLPLLNKYINEYMQKFTGFDFTFYIDNNFKENVIFKSRDREFHSLSNGQGFRMTFSILFAFLKLVEERNGISTNLLILDEIADQSIDINGREELLSMLKDNFSLTKDIIIISHNTEILNNEIFDRKYIIKQDKGFSKISYVD